MNHGIASAARQVQALGRAPDTMLAHVSPDEAKLIDYLQGGTKTNPNTGLPEYGLLGDILKGIVRAAGAVVGFTIGGPAGAAAGAGLTTKLTGGSWKDALTGAALSGVGGLVGQGMSGGGWGLTGAKGLSPMTLDLAAPGAASAGSVSLPAIAAPSGLGALSAGNLMATAGSAGGLGAAVPAAFSKDEPTDSGPPMPELPRTNINLNVEPSNRQYRPYLGDYNRFAEPGGGMGHLFFDPVNERPRVAAAPMQDQAQLEQQFMARGGRVRGYSLGGPAGPLGGRGITEPTMLRGPQMPMQQMPMGPGVPGMGVGQPNQRQAGIIQAAMRGYMMGSQMGFARGGDVRGVAALQEPRSQRVSDGKSDSVPAMLSVGEHVIDAQTVSQLGNGDNDAGHRVIENFKQQARAGAGQKNPRAPSPKINTSHASVARMVKRAKHKAKAA